MHFVVPVTRAIVALTVGAALVAGVGAEPAAATVHAAPTRGAVARAAAALDVDGVIPGSLVVTAMPTSAGREVAARAEDLVGVTGTTHLGGDVVRVDVEAGHEAPVAAVLAARDDVLAVEPDQRLDWHAVPDDPLYPRQWAHQMTGVEQAWDVTTGDGVLVAVLDSGIDGRHPELADRIVERVDASTGEIRPGAIDNDPCGVGHGTAVAGVVAAASDNGAAIAGVVWNARIVDVALTSEDSGCQNGPTLSASVAALHHVAQLDPAPVVANMSFGGVTPVCAQAYATAVDAARAAGIVLVAAAGNDERSRPGQSQTPASCPGVLSVGAVRNSGDIAGYSQQNPSVDLVAPGGSASAFGDRDDRFATEILTTCRTDVVHGGCDGVTTLISGTSFAAPYVAGVAALMRAVDDSLTVDAVEAVLEGTATDLGEDGRDDAFGWGLVAAGDAIAAAVAGEIPPLQPDPAFPVGVVVARVGATTTTEAVAQAVAMSELAFPDEAEHAVIARADDFADALAGSGLGFGQGPLLFTSRTGPLDPATADELERILSAGATVYLMGGTAALAANIDEDVRALGFVPRRFAGETREDTAALAAPEVRRLLEGSGYPDLHGVLIATRGDWPDAVTGGSLAAFWGMPVLLTPVDALHDRTEEALRALAPSEVLVLGGEAVIAEGVRERIADVTGVDPLRLAGPTRTGTAVAIAQHQERLVVAAYDRGPGAAIAVNVRRADGFAHVLSATALAGTTGGVLLPVEEEEGTLLTDDVVSYACEVSVPALIIAGGTDVVGEDVVPVLRDALEGRDPPCTAEAEEPPS